MSDQDQLSQVESWLRRALTQEELSPAESLELLSMAQRAVVEAIAPRSAFAAMLYLRNIVSNALMRDLQPFVEDFASGTRTAVPRPPVELANLPLFEHHAGRALSPAEKQPVVTLEQLSPAHVALAAALARQDRTVAFLYLRRVVPSAEIDACDALVKQLAADPEA